MRTPLQEAAIKAALETVPKAPHIGRVHSMAWADALADGLLHYRPPFVYTPCTLISMGLWGFFLEALSMEALYRAHIPPDLQGAYIRALRIGVLCTALVWPYRGLLGRRI